VTPGTPRVRLPAAGYGSVMSILDKITGRAKKAAGDLTDDASLRHEGRLEERKGEAKDELSSASERADAKADEVADLERKTT
jgi:uncharacterized protein YjbJ (UPF0337 family)